MPADRAALGAFLRSRRDALSPARAGVVPLPGPRRVPGLRKEELAALVGLSTDHYSRLEQGRQPTLTDQMVDALARALHLDDVERAHLRDLAAPSLGRRSAVPEAPQRPEPGMLRLLATLDHVPALLLGRRSEVLAANLLVRAVLGTPMQPGTSFVRWLLLEPQARQRIANWDDFAAASVGALRFELGRRPGDVRLQRLVAELCSSDPEVAAWWDDQRVTFRTSLVKRIAHPAAGMLEFDIESVVGPQDADQRLVVYTVAPDSHAARMLPLLAGWSLSEVGLDARI